MAVLCFNKHTRSCIFLREGNSLWCKALIRLVVFLALSAAPDTMAPHAIISISLLHIMLCGTKGNVLAIVEGLYPESRHRGCIGIIMIIIQNLELSRTHTPHTLLDIAINSLVYMYTSTTEQSVASPCLHQYYYKLLVLNTIMDQGVSPLSFIIISIIE